MAEQALFTVGQLLPARAHRDRRLGAADVGKSVLTSNGL
jgi:hypothetical protein